jgi:hypothetical protein
VFQVRRPQASRLAFAEFGPVRSTLDRARIQQHHEACGRRVGASGTIKSFLDRQEEFMDSVIKGNAGEFYVLAELSPRGWTAAQTPRNARAFDILARQGSRQVAIRVKTKTHVSTGFQWNAKKDGAIFPEIGGNDYCILVDIPEVTADNSASPVYYIVPTEKLDRWLREDFDRWVNTPGPIKVQRSQDNTRRNHPR